MCTQCAQFYKEVVLRLSEHGDVIENANNKVCSPQSFLANSVPDSYSPHPLYIGMLFPTVFFVVFMHILPDVDLMPYITSCKTSSIKIWFVLAAGLAENLTQLVFRQPSVIQHVRNDFLSAKHEIFYILYFFITV